jgi:hypothetical protein
MFTTQAKVRDCANVHYASEGQGLSFTINIAQSVPGSQGRILTPPSHCVSPGTFHNLSKHTNCQQIEKHFQYGEEDLETLANSIQARPFKTSFGELHNCY